MDDGRPRIEIRPLRPEDDLARLTALIRRAYGRLADMGFRYLATWQNEQVTRERAEKGECYVALADGRTAGTVTLYPPGREADCEYYRRPGVAMFGQFAVEPEMQGRGIGRLLLDRVERRAAEIGAAEIALDTAEGAAHLIEMYRRRGYAVVGVVDWEVTNYKSVIMAKKTDR